MCTYNNETSKDYKQYTISSMIILLPIILISSYGLPVYFSLTWPPGRPQVKVVCHTPLCVVKIKAMRAILHWGVGGVLISLPKAVSPYVVIPLLSATHGQYDARPTRLPSQLALVPN